MRRLGDEMARKRLGTDGRTDGWTPDSPLWDKLYLLAELKTKVK